MEHQHFSLHIAAASPLEKYPAKQHARRVADFLGVEKGLIYLPGAPTAYLEDSDQFVPFRQRRYFYYLSGVDEPDCHLTYDIRLDTLMLYVPAAGSPRKVYYNGRGSTPEEALEKYDIDAVHWASAVADYVEFWMTQHEGDVYILHPDQAVVPGHDKSPRVNYTKLQAAVDAARVRKDQHEIKLIRRANEISAKAHENVLRNILKFRNEAQVEASFLDTCVTADAKHQAYEIIAAAGENAATLHYIKNDEPFGDRQLMCLDAGCEWQCYASDVTRTFPLTGRWPSKEAKEIYDLVLKMQTKCIEAIRPGARYLDIHYMAHRILIDGLLELGIFHNGTAQEIFDAGTSLAFLPHGLGHHLGLEVHDVSDVPLMASTRHNASPVVDPEMCKAPVNPSSAALEEGMIVTVEPGIYFNRYALNAVYFSDPTHSKYINRKVLLRYLPVGGVRIEDDILVTDDGYENLTTAPKGEEMLRLIQEGLSESPGGGVAENEQGKNVPSKATRRRLHATSSRGPSRNEGIETWSQQVSSGRSATLGEMPTSPKIKCAVELEGRGTNPTTPQRSRPASLSAAPASFEAIGWPSHEDSVASELPSESSNTPQPPQHLDRQSSHWRKIPPALARMASTQSLSNHSLPEYTPSQMFQRPRQAPIPPQKLPELPAKPLAYRQSMPIIISGSNATKPSSNRSPIAPPPDARSKPGVPRYRLTRDHIRPEPKSRGVEENADKRQSGVFGGSILTMGTETVHGPSQQDKMHLSHRASVAIGEQHRHQNQEQLDKGILHLYQQRMQQVQEHREAELQIATMEALWQQKEAQQHSVHTYRRQHPTQSQQSTRSMAPSPPPSWPGNVGPDLREQIGFLNRQSRERMAMSNQQQQQQQPSAPPNICENYSSPPVNIQLGPPQDFAKVLELLEQQKKKRVAMAKERQPRPPQQPSALLDYYKQLEMLQEQNSKRLALARAEQQ